MSKEIPNRERAKEDAKTKETPKAVRDAHRKVTGHVEEGKPGPAVEHVQPGPDTKPST